MIAAWRYAINVNDQLNAYAKNLILFCICRGRSRPSTTRMSNTKIGGKILTGHSYYSWNDFRIEIFAWVRKLCKDKRCWVCSLGKFLSYGAAVPGRKSWPLPRAGYLSRAIWSRCNHKTHPPNPLLFQREGGLL